MTITGTAAFTLANLEEDNYLALIGWSRGELDALDAGIHGLTGDDRARQNAQYAAQSAAQQDIVKDALAHGVPADAIMAITHRNQWDAR